MEKQYNPIEVGNRVKIRNTKTNEIMEGKVADTEYYGVTNQFWVNFTDSNGRRSSHPFSRKTGKLYGSRKWYKDENPYEVIMKTV